MGEIKMLSEKLSRTLKIFTKNPTEEFTTTQISYIINYSGSRARQLLRELVKLGHIRVDSTENCLKWRLKVVKE